MRKFIGLLLLTLVFSCKKNEIPKGILSQEKMVKILIDTHIAEAQVNNLNIKARDTANAVYLVMEEKIFKKNRVTKKKYIKSFKYYNSYPDIMDNLYAQVVDSLNIRQKILKLD